MVQKDEHQIRAAIYIRVSSEEQKEKYGPDLQLASITALFQSKGKLNDGRDAVVLAGNQYIYRDEAVSGTVELAERSGFSQLIEDITISPEGQLPFDLVAVYKIDRFARRLKILLDVIDLFEQKGIQFISANESIDTSTPFGKAILAIVGVIAELEIETTKMRTQDGRKQAIENGVVMGSVAPYGYKKDAESKLQIFDKTPSGLDKEAEVVKKIFGCCAYQKMTPQMIAIELTKNEYLSPEASAVFHGKRKGEIKKKNDQYFWRAERVREILENRVYLGEYWTGKNKNGKALPQAEWKLSSYRHEPIIDLGTFEIVQESLRHSSMWDNLMNVKNRDHIYLLSGLLKCEHCRNLSSPPDFQMMGWTGGRKKLKPSSTKNENEYGYYYHCNRKNPLKHSKTCSTIPIPADPLENYIVNFVTDLLHNPKAVFEHQQRLPSTRKRIKQLKRDRQYFNDLQHGVPQRRKHLRDQQEIGAISTEQLKAKLRDLDINEKQYHQKIEEFDQQISQQAISEGYIQSFEVFRQKYGEVLGDIQKNRKQLYEVLHLLIDEVVIKSRPVNPEIDVVAGRKKVDQVIPDKLEIKLRLPQHLLHQLIKDQVGFEDKNPNL